MNDFNFHPKFLKRKMILLILLISTTAGAEGLSKLELAAIGATAADLITTEIGIERYGLTEANPLMKNRGVRIAYGAGQAALFIWLGRWAERRGSDRMAKVFLLMHIAYHITATGWNANLLLTW